MGKKKIIMSIVILLLLGIVAVESWYLFGKKEEEKKEEDTSVIQVDEEVPGEPLEHLQTKVLYNHEVDEQEKEELNDEADKISFQLKLSNVNGKLQLKYIEENKENEVIVSGITGEVDYFSLYISDCGGIYDIIAVTKDKKAYLVKYDSNRNDNISGIPYPEMKFSKIQTEEEIVDLFLADLRGMDYVGCGNMGKELYVKLKDSSMRSVEIDTDDKITLGKTWKENHPWQAYLNLGRVGSITLSDNNSIRIKDDTNNYLVKDENNKEIKAKAIYTLEEDNENGNNYFIIYIVTSEDKLYQMKFTSDQIVDGKHDNQEKATLVNNKQVKSFTPSTTGFMTSSSEDEEIHLNESITFTDGTKLELKELSELYVNENE